MSRPAEASWVAGDECVLESVQPIPPSFHHVDISAAGWPAQPFVQAVSAGVHLPPEVSTLSDDDIGQYRDVLALFRKLEVALQTGDIASIGRDVDRFYAWLLAEGSKAPAFLRQAAQRITQLAQDELNKVPADQPLPLPDDPLSHPQLTFFLAHRRYNWAVSKNDPELLRKEVEAIVAWLSRCQDTCAGFEKASVQELIEQLRQSVDDKPSAQANNSAEQESQAQTASPASPPVHEEEEEDDDAEDAAGPERSASAIPLFVPLARTSGWVPDLPLLEFQGGNTWTLRDSVEGTLILGSVGSGKTSGSGRAIAHIFLSHGYGGLVLTAKPDEADLWRWYAKASGREDQLCVVKPRGKFRFNFLNHLGNLPADAGGSVEDIVTFFYGLLECFAAGEGTGGADAFWEKAGKELVRQIVRLARASGEPLRVDTIRKILDGAPRTAEEAAKLRDRKTQSLNAEARYFAKLYHTAADNAPGTRDRAATLEALNYWLQRFPDLNHRTRSIVITSFTSMIDLFFDADLNELLCQDTTIVPGDVLDGAVIVLDVPVLRSPAMGRILQLVWKYFFQTAVERRDDPDDDSRRPVFLWVDEAQYFWSQHDGRFASTSRSLRCANVYLTQNLPNYYALTGGKDAVHRTDGFFACLNTKIFHANNDRTTNHWAAEQIGRALKLRATYREPPERGPRPFLSLFTGEPSGAGSQQMMDFDVEPAEFSRLRTGSAQYQFLVDAFIVKSGATFANGKHFFKATFEQEKRP
jgi:hypothetical protein